jgi:predicted alpha/beta hydrolase family esterase
VTFVAPAWNRGWVSDLPPVGQLYNRGVIIHGTADDKVPLAHSAQLSLATGMPLYIFDGMGHINILKHKNNPKAGRLLTDEEKKALLNKDNT